ncbi:MAG: hypothetical protein LBO09_03860 [Candidatus Peribacteria bacterium]|jgi:hypothetical protein|nr:hypothetical protein [Candidatus Peribacteria bacterium]
MNEITTTTGTVAKKPIDGNLKVLFAGPPHSGKSIAETFLRNILPLQDTMRIAAQPDGEGDWTQKTYGENPELAQQLRNKGTFTRENVEHRKNQIKNSDSRFTLVDVGGVVSEENKELADQANAMIIVSSNPEKTQEWVDLANEKGLHILAVLNSTLDTTKSDLFSVVSGKPWETEGVVVGLDRGNFKDSKTLREVAAYMMNKVPEKEKKEIASYEPLTIIGIAKNIGKQEEQITLPGREPTMGLNRKPEDLSTVYQSLQKMATQGGNFVIDGRAPQYLVVDILHALHPNKVALADSKVEGGMVGISGQNVPKGLGSGPLPFTITPDFQGGTLVEYAKDAFVIVDNKQLNEIIPPEVENGKPVFLSGKTSNWASAEIAMSYAHIVPAVYLYQPGTGFICVITHNVAHELGSVIKDNPPQ